MNFTILGAGTWGITLGQILQNNNHKVSIWHYKKQYIEALLKNRFHQGLNCDIHKNINFIFNPQDINQSSYIIICLPSQKIRETLSFLDLKNTYYINASKGIEIQTGKLISNIKI